MKDAVAAAGAAVVGDETAAAVGAAARRVRLGIDAGARRHAVVRAASLRFNG